VAKTTNQDERVNQATYLARDIAPDIDLILITHYPDVETLDTVRPGETDLQTVLAVNRAVALEMLEAGVEVLVQRIDRAAFRRWMSDRDDTPENRRAWIDRTRLLRGSAALEVLGLGAPTSPRVRPSARRRDLSPTNCWRRSGMRIVGSSMSWFRGSWPAGELTCWTWRSANSGNARAMRPAMT
jgi:hypothetical protein